MHKHPMSFCLLVGAFLSVAAPAQQNIVYYPNNTLSGANNYFPFGPARGVRQQQLIPGSVFNNQPVLIQDLLIPFARPSTVSTVTSGEIVYGDFHIQMSVYGGSTLSNVWATNIPNPTTVYRGRLRQRWANSTWMAVGLEQPFLFLPLAATDNLVVDFTLYNIQDPGNIVPDVNGYHLSAHSDAAVARTYLLGWPSNQAANANVGTSGIKLGFVLGSGNFVARGYGCTSSASTIPTIGLAAGTWPQIGGMLTLQVNGAAASRPSFPILGSSETSYGAVPLPFSLDVMNAIGCQLWIDPLVTLPAAVTNAAGSASLPFPVPNVSTLMGVRVRAQWAMLDGGANPAGLVTSDYGLLILGS